MITPKKIKEVLEHNCINLRFHARGGQGGVTASNLCVEAFYGYGICQPRFGAERMGSPTESYVRLSLSKELIRSNEQVYAPHFVAILDESLMWEINVTEGLPKGGWIIINTDMNQLEIQELIERKDLNIATIPATTIALDVFGRNITNTIILGALIRVSQLFSLEELSNAIQNRFKGSIIEKNIKAIKQAIDATCVYEVEDEIDFTVDTKVAWTQIDPFLPGYEELDKAGVWYCDEDVISYGSKQVKTGSWGEYDIIWDKETCTDCAQCWYICPDFAILREKGEDELWHMTGVDQFHCKSCLNCVNICPVNALSKKLKQRPGTCAVEE